MGQSTKERVQLLNYVDLISFLVSKVHLMIPLTGLCVNLAMCSVAYDKEGRQPNVASIPLSAFCVNIDFHIGPVSVSVVCDQKNKKILLKDFLVLT